MSVATGKKHPTPFPNVRRKPTPHSDTPAAMTHDGEPALSEASGEEEPVVLRGKKGRSSLAQA